MAVFAMMDKIEATRGARRWSLDNEKSASACLAPTSSQRLEGLGAGAWTINKELKIYTFLKT